MAENSLSNNELPKNYSDIPDEFNYSKISDETDAILEYLEQITEEVTKMRVECCIANIELLSTIDAIDFEGKINELQKLNETYKVSETENNTK